MRPTFPKTVLFHNIVAPYRHALFRELAKTLDLEVWYSTLITRDRKWAVRIPDDYRSVDLRGRTYYALGRPLTLCLGVTKRLAKSRPDIVVAVLTRQNAVDVARIARWCHSSRTPLVLWVGDVRQPDVRDQVPRAIAAPLSFLTNASLRRAKGIISYSRLTDRWLDAKGVHLPVVTGTQVLESQGTAPRLDVPEDELPIRVLFVGKIERRKGIEEFALALQRLPEAVRRNCKLIVAGVGPLRERVASLQETGLTVSFLGHVRADDMPLVYRDADLLVLPSLEDPWGFVVNEAMSMGTPALVSMYCGSAELAAKAGWVVDVRNAEAFATQLQQAIAACRDADLRRRAASAVKEYSPERAAESISQFLHGLCKPSKDSVG